MTERRRVEGEREVFTYMYLYDAAVLSAERVREYQRDCMTTILYCAFLLEAYMNHVGSRVFPQERWEKAIWDNPKKKLKAIAKKIDYPLDLNKEPFKSFPLIFKFRRGLVHGKTITLSFENEQVFERGKAPALPETAWEKMLTISTAEKFFKDTKTMMEELHNFSGLEHDLFTFNWRSRWKASSIEDFSSRKGKRQR